MKNLYCATLCVFLTACAHSPYVKEEKKYTEKDFAFINTSTSLREVTDRLGKTAVWSISPEHDFLIYYATDGKFFSVQTDGFQVYEVSHGDKVLFKKED